MYGSAQTVAARRRYKLKVRNGNLVREADLVVAVWARALGFDAYEEAVFVVADERVEERVACPAYA